MCNSFITMTRCNILSPLSSCKIRIIVQHWTSSGRGSVFGIATGYGLEDPGIESRWRARFSAPVQIGPGAHPASRTMDTGSFPEVKSGRSVKLTPHPLLVPWSWKSIAIPLLPLWVVRPVQSLSACTRVHFTLPYWTSARPVRTVRSPWLRTNQRRCCHSTFPPVFRFIAPFPLPHFNL